MVIVLLVCKQGEHVEGRVGGTHVMRLCRCGYCAKYSTMRRFTCLVRMLYTSRNSVSAGPCQREIIDMMYSCVTTNGT